MKSDWQIKQGAACACKGHDEYCACQNVRREYRGWEIDYIYPPIPVRSFDYRATHISYDGPEDNRILYAATREALELEIDAWIDENEPEQAREVRSS